MRLGARDIRHMLQGRLRELLGKLLPGGSYTSNTYVVRNPTRDDRKPGSFVIWTRGGAAGSWREHAAPCAKGDVIDLISYVHGREGDRRFALRWAEDFLGIERMSPGELERSKLAHKVREERQAKAEEEAAARRRRRAFDLWAGAQHRITGTVAQAYLEGARKLRLADIPHPERDLRFLPDLEWWMGAQHVFRGGRRIKTAPGPSFPAIVSAVREVHGSIVAVHCTFLQPDGSDKAPVTRPKLMFGAVAGGVIRVAKGPSGLTPEEAKEAGVVEPLIITEGIEDALSCAMAIPEARVWAATMLSNIANVPVWHPCVGDVVVAADNDWNNPQAEADLERVLEALASSGKRVSVMRSHIGKDFNDLIRGEE